MKLGIRILEKIMVFHNSWWMESPVTIYQNLDEKEIIKVEITGSTGQLILYPLPEETTKVVTLSSSREPTTIDFKHKVYSCSLGISTFTLKEKVIL